MGARAPSPQEIRQRGSNTSHGSFQERSSTTTSVCAVYPAPRSTQLGHEMPDFVPLDRLETTQRNGYDGRVYGYFKY